MSFSIICYGTLGPMDYSTETRNGRVYSQACSDLSSAASIAGIPCVDVRFLQTLRKWVYRPVALANAYRPVVLYVTKHTTVEGTNRSVDK